MKCHKCQLEIFLPFKCQYCGEFFCSEHRLPENHQCPQIEQARLPTDGKHTIILRKQEPYEYRITYAPSETKRKKTRFSIKEIEHLAVAALLVVGIGLSLTIFSYSHANVGEPDMLAAFTATLTISFFIHEIAHKIAAQRKGLWAEFRLTAMGAILTLFSIFSPFFKIISPGAVMIAGIADRENIGRISIAGPSTNIALSTIFLCLTLPMPQHASTPIFLLGAAYNAWIALFNLIPFGIFDGFKVFLWNKRIWALAFSASLILTLVSYELLI